MSKAQDHAYDYIHQRIMDGRFPPGHHLKEEEIATACGISRTPVRLAIRDLVEIGLVTVRENRRSYVVDSDVALLEEMFDVLVFLEGYSAELAAQRITPAQIRELRALAEEMNQFAGDPADSVDFLEINARFHRTIHQANGNPTLLAMMGRVLDYPTTLYLKFGQHTESETAQRQHLEIIDALEANDPELSGMLMRLHLETVRRQYREMMPAKMAQSRAKAAWTR